MISQLTINRLAREQHNKCWNCPHTFDHWAGHIHHGIIPKGQTNYRKFKKWLDMPENLVLVCWECHEQHGDLTNTFARDCMWSDKIDAGYDMQAWRTSIPMRDKVHQFIYLGKKERKPKLHLLCEIADSIKKRVEENGI